MKYSSVLALSSVAAAVSNITSVDVVTDLQTTLVTITLCKDNACSETVQPTGYYLQTITETGVVTHTTVYCPLTESSVAPTTSATSVPVAPTSAPSSVSSAPPAPAPPAPAPPAPAPPAPAPVSNITTAVPPVVYTNTTAVVASTSLASTVEAHASTLSESVTAQPSNSTAAPESSVAIESSAAAESSAAPDTTQTYEAQTEVPTSPAGTSSIFATVPANGAGKIKAASGAVLGLGALLLL